MSGAIIPPEVMEKIHEYQAKAMLLGMEYDPRDHTINRFKDGDVSVYDADTLEKLPPFAYARRVGGIDQRKLGPDWLHTIKAEDRDMLWMGISRSAELPRW